MASETQAIFWVWKRRELTKVAFPSFTPGIPSFGIYALKLACVSAYMHLVCFMVLWHFRVSWLSILSTEHAAIFSTQRNTWNRRNAETYGQETCSQETYSQETYSQETYIQETLNQEIYSQETYSQETYSQETFSQETKSQESYRQKTYSQETYSKKNL